MGWIPASHEHRARTYGALRTDRRLAVIALALLQEPDSPRQLEHWARWSGISSRTLVCGFKLEPGLSFGRWRSLARLLCSIEPLSAGVPVSEVGPRVGYENPSSFIAIFKSFFGVTPAVYVKRVAKQQTYIAECTAVSAGMRRIAEDTRTVRILRCDSPSTTRSPRHRRGREMERPRPRN
jgi:AraC-like DNA-binding protein